MAAKFQFPCPECGTTLRLQDRKLVGRSLPCPECQSELGLVDDRGGIKAIANIEELAASRPVKPKRRRSAATKSRQAATPVAAAAVGIQEAPQAGIKSAALAKGQSIATAAKPIGAAIATPVGIGWTVAGTVAAVLVGSIWLGGGDDGDASSNDEVGVASVKEDESGAAAVAVVDSKTEIKPAEKPVPEGIALTPSEAGLVPVGPAQPANPSAPSRPSAPEQGKLVDPPDIPPAATQTQPSPVQPAPPENPPTPQATVAETADQPNVPAQPMPEDTAAPTVDPTPQALAKPEVAKVDIQASLSQELREYRLAKPVPLRSMLIELESMIGVPIAIDTQRIRDTNSVLGTDVSVSLKSTTVGDLLTASLKPAGLAYKVRDAEILVVPSDD